MISKLPAHPLRSLSETLSHFLELHTLLGRQLRLQIRVHAVHHRSEIPNVLTAQPLRFLLRPLNDRADFFFLRLRQIQTFFQPPHDVQTNRRSSS